MSKSGPAELEAYHRRKLRAFRRAQAARPRRFAGATRLGAAWLLFLLFGGPFVLLGLVPVFLFGPEVIRGFLRNGVQDGDAAALLAVAVAAIVFWSAWFAFRLFRSVERAAGVELSRTDAPGLYEALDDARARLGAGRFHGVLAQVLDGAFVERLPALGPLGPVRRRVVVGPPLLATLSDAQARSVLAHEVAHTLPGSGLPPAWVTWTAAAAATRWGNPGASAWLQRATLRLHARVRAGSLAAEAFADTRSAHVATPEVAGAALTRIAQLMAWLGRVHWPRVHRAQGFRAVPPGDAFSAILRRLAAGDAEDPTPLAEVLRDHTAEDDSHPSLLERLSHLRSPTRPAPAGPERDAAIARVTATYPALPVPSAWEAWLTADARDRVLAVIDRVFQEGSRVAWEVAHVAVQQARDALDTDRELLTNLPPGDPPRLEVPDDLPAATPQLDLEDDAPAASPFRLRGPLSADPIDLDRTAALVGRAAPGGAGEPALRWLIQQNDQLSGAWFHLGEALALREDEASGHEAVACFERSAALPTRRTHAAWDSAHDKLRALGEPERAEAARREHEALALAAEGLDLALRKPPKPGQLAPPEVTRLTRARIRRQLAAFPTITGAWLCSLPHLRHEAFPGVVQHALFYRVKKPWHRLENEHRHQNEQAALASLLDFSAPLVVWNLNHPARKLVKAVKRVDDALLHTGTG